VPGYPRIDAPEACPLAVVGRPRSAARGRQRQGWQRGLFSSPSPIRFARVRCGLRSLHRRRASNPERVCHGRMCRAGPPRARRPGRTPSPAPAKAPRLSSAESRLPVRRCVDELPAARVAVHPGCFLRQPAFAIPPVRLSLAEAPSTPLERLRRRFLELREPRTEMSEVRATNVTSPVEALESHASERVHIGVAAFERDHPGPAQSRTVRTACRQAPVRHPAGCKIARSRRNAEGPGEVAVLSAFLLCVDQDIARL